MTYIYVNGDSHSAGVSLPSDSMSFANLIAKHFDLQLVNQSLPGGSNQRAIRITQDWIRTSQAKYFVLVGWTSWEREEWPYRGDFFQANSSADTFGDADLDQRYKTWVNGLDANDIPTLGQAWHENIWQFHKKLQDRQIPHLFFNCFYDFFVDKSGHHDWDNCFFHPYDSDWSYWHYATSQGCKPFREDDLHLGADAHKIWANLLIAHIEKYKLLK